MSEYLFWRYRWTIFDDEDLGLMEYDYADFWFYVTTLTNVGEVLMSGKRSIHGDIVSLHAQFDCVTTATEVHGPMNLFFLECKICGHQRMFM